MVKDDNRNSEAEEIATSATKEDLKRRAAKLQELLLALFPPS